ncbi:hypothetical protein NHQ30_003353 [Ciborinia camelliae]|nr:hypothetical protein NHQ30_003353 [Ciborinia camelliae]
MDGLLLNTEDIYTHCANHILHRYNRPALPWPIKAQMMGVPGGSTSGPFLTWARLPISKEQYAQEQRAQQLLHFPTCAPLPGVEKLLTDLTTARDNNKDQEERGNRIQIALATSSNSENYTLKTQNPATKALLERFPPSRRILGDDARVSRGRGKPCPDIYLLALRIINASLGENERPITPGECLVFEDSVPGVEAGRRAGMRVVWVPHEGLRAEYRGREKEILAGRMGMARKLGIEIGDGEDPGEIDDGWAQLLPSLENFPYELYGIAVS